MASMMQPHSQGKPQLISNINAVMAVADVVRTTLGPRGTDKLIHDDKGNTIISNDGATIMKLLDIVHPAAKILADIASEKVHLHYRIMEVEQYKIIEKIGEGASGVVYKALDTKNNVIVALKEIHVHRVNGIKASNLREVSILKKLQHENVVRLLDVVYTRKRLYAVLEYLDMSLAKHIVSCLEYSDDPYHVKVFLLQLLRGIDYCHSKGVMHRDLKPENLLIDLKSKSLKLADFGLSRVIHCKTLTPKVGTLFYIPPEILLGSDKYSFSSDMWSIGCIFAEMVTRKPLFAGDSEARKVVKGSSEIRQLYRIFQIMGTPKEDTWPGITCLPTFPELVAKDLASVVPDLDDAGVDLLRKMLSLNPSSRITAKVALEHAYFKRLTSP